MHTVFALLCFVVVIHWLIFPYPSGLLPWHCGNLTIAPVPAKQPWWIWINTSCEFIMNDCIATTKQSTTKPSTYFLWYTVGHNCHGGIVTLLINHNRISMYAIMYNHHISINVYSCHNPNWLCWWPPSVKVYIDFFAISKQNDLTPCDQGHPCHMPRWNLVNIGPHGPLTRYVILWVAYAPGMPGTFFTILRVSDPNMHHGTCVTHVPWSLPESLTSGFLWSQWRGKRSWHSKRMRNQQFNVSGKRRMVCHLLSSNPSTNQRFGWLHLSRALAKTRSVTGIKIKPAPLFQPVQIFSMMSIGKIG